MENPNLCVICGKKADATGSHIIPANLIKNCVGSRYYEESFEIDLLNRNTNMFLGRSNPLSFPENNSELGNIPMSETHHYVVDNILCTKCEAELGKIEGFIYKEFVEKARVDKFRDNFTIDKFELNDLIRSNKIKSEMFYCYFYSIILRIDKFTEIHSGKFIIKKEHLKNILKFLKGYLYEPKTDYATHIKNYGLFVHLKNLESKNNTLSQVNVLQHPIFNLCEFNLIFYSVIEFGNPFSDYINRIDDEKFNVLSNSYHLENLFYKNYVEYCNSINIKK